MIENQRSLAMRNRSLGLSGKTEAAPDYRVRIDPVSALIG
jgi:hypothetical protein